MNIIAHRGFWLNKSEKNTAVAFSRALKHGFGIETDFRDLNGELVISHDLPNENSLTAKNFIEIFKENPVENPIALNIKSDGLYGLIEDLIKHSGMSRYFAFDMSIPDTRGYISFGIPIYSRLSEYEPYPAFLNQSEGIWIDAFEGMWYDMDIINAMLNKNKSISFVSPELHGRQHNELWNFLIKNQLHKIPKISICTDYPLKAKEFFNDQN
jgi:hypothetical protein